MFSFLLFVSLVVAACPSSLNCRCLYGQPCWPSKSAFSALSSQLSQPLLKPRPVASPCYSTSSPSEIPCTDISENFFDAPWRTDQPGALQYLNFETYRFRNGSIGACYLNTTLGAPCEQGVVPPVGVDARNVGDVQAAIRFAARYNLRLVVKNTGHDVMGRSSARGGFLLWTHHLKNIEYHPSLVLDGGHGNEVYDVITLGAGVQFGEVYEAVEQHGRIFVGGGCSSVGAVGGWLMGGGHSPLSPRHGLGVDNVIQFNLVTAAGTYLTANTHQNPDLYWALRGGAGGTYGVLTSATFLTHPQVPITLSTLSATFSSEVMAATVLTEFVRFNSQVTTAGWGGYALISAEQLSIILLSSNTSQSDTNTTILSFFDFVGNATGGEAVFNTASYESFYSLYKEVFSRNDGAGTNLEMVSRFLPQDIAERDPGAVAQAMMDVVKDGSNLTFMMSGGAILEPDPASMGLHPAWRKAVAYVGITTTWPDGSSAEDIDKLRQKIKARGKILDDSLSMEPASYINEGSAREDLFQETFFGEHYGRLKDIKNKYDPLGLFVVASGVGSNEWNHDLNCRGSVLNRNQGEVDMKSLALHEQTVLLPASNFSWTL